ncbi:sterol desaturase family protein [Paraburkholderia sp. 40]|uniref:sterol desaturase family protein n=1 Tax=unclassified Paraburkholderia TaxID=2615204 RepID=UPI003D1AF580
MDYGRYLLPAFALLLGIEIICGRHKKIYSREDWLINVITFGAGFMLRPLVAILIGSVATFALPAEKGALGHVSFGLGLAGVILVADFCFYWVHRWAHAARRWRHPWLWQIHRTHHSGKYLNVGVIFRIHPFWWFLLPTSWVYGFAVYLGLEKEVAVASLILGTWNVFTHSNFRWDDKVRRMPVLGRVFWALEHVVVSPGIHHTHHGFGKDGANYRNFAVMISFYDLIFGTLLIPAGRPAHYGLPGEQAHWPQQLLSPILVERKAGQTAPGE